MLDNQSIIVEAITGNYNITSPPNSNPFIGGAFMGSTYNESNVISTQEVNPFLLGKVSEYVKSLGKGVAHKLTEEFQGGKISLKEKRDVEGALRFGKNSDHLKAHKREIKQSVRDQSTQKRFIHPDGSTSTDSKGAVDVEYFMKYRNNFELILETRR